MITPYRPAKIVVATGRTNCRLSQEFRQHILELGMIPVIPPRSNRKEPADYDRHLYRERHLVECFINKIKHYRRIFSRFEKLDTRYLGFLHFTAALIWLW